MHQSAIDPSQQKNINSELKEIIERERSVIIESAETFDDLKKLSVYNTLDNAHVPIKELESLMKKIQFATIQMRIYNESILRVTDAVITYKDTPKTKNIDQIEEKSLVAIDTEENFQQEDNKSSFCIKFLSAVIPKNIALSTTEYISTQYSNLQDSTIDNAFRIEGLSGLEFNSPYQAEQQIRNMKNQRLISSDEKKKKKIISIIEKNKTLITNLEEYEEQIIKFKFEEKKVFILRENFLKNLEKFYGIQTTWKNKELAQNQTRKILTISDTNDFEDEQLVLQ